MFATADEYRAGLKLLAQQQRGRLTSLIEQTERTLHTDWQHARDIVMRYYAPIIDRYAKDLAALRASAAAAAAGEDGASSMALDLSWLTDQNPQLASIQQSVSAAFNSYGSNAAAAVSDAQAQAVDAGAEDAAALTQRALWPAVEGAGVPPGVLFDRPLPEALSQWINRASNGLQIAQLFDGFGEQAAREVRQAMMLGLAMGENPRAMSSAISNALGISRSRATIIGRTEALSAYRSAQHEIYRANSDVLGGWLWSAGGPNPCAACMGMDGLQFSLEEELIDHPCGACSPLPVTRSWDDILGPLGIDTSDMEETSLGADGAYISGEDRLLQMSPAQQQAVFGTKTGYEAWQRGEVSLRDFAGIRSGGGYDGMLYQKSLRELQIPTRQASRLVEPNPELLAKLRAGRLRGTDLGRVTPEDAMPAWAKQSEASRIVYQILRNGLPYDLMSHEQGLLIINLQEMLRGELPVNVRAAVERQLIALGQPVERQTVGEAARVVDQAATTAAEAEQTASQEALDALVQAQARVDSLRAEYEAALASGDIEGISERVDAARWDVARAQAEIDRENGGRGAVVRTSSIYNAFNADKEVAAATRNIFGHALTSDELASVVGAPDGSYVSIMANEDTLFIDLKGPNFDPVLGINGPEAEYSAQRIVRLRGQQIVVENSSFFIGSDFQGRGIGARIFADQAQSLSDLGVNRIETYAAGWGPNVPLGEAEANGYYTWPRFGYVGNLPEDALQRLGAAIADREAPASWSAYTTVQQLMATPDGRAWWKANGSGINLMFDLSSDSYSMRVLRDYLASKGIE